MYFKMDFLLVGLMQVIGFFVQGTTGFGCTVIAAAVTNGILGTSIGVPYGTIITLPFLFYLGIQGRKEVSWKDLGKIILGCAPGIIIGNMLFYKISAQTAKIGIGAMIIVIATMNIHKHIIKPLVMKDVEENEIADTTGKKIFRYGCLLLGGVVHGAFNIGGPLITVYTLEAIKDKKSFRNTMTWLWCVLNTWNALSQYRAVPDKPYLMSALAVGIPLAGIGFFFGVRFLEKINRVQFLRIVYAVLMLIGVNMFKGSVPWTPELVKYSSIGLGVAFVGYSFMVMKKRNENSVTGA